MLFVCEYLQDKVIQLALLIRRLVIELFITTCQSLGARLAHLFASFLSLDDGLSGSELGHLNRHRLYGALTSTNLAVLPLV